MKLLKVSLENLESVEMSDHSEEEKSNAITLLMNDLMMVTGFNRIHSKADMREFIFRIAISLNSIDIIKNWFEHEVFFVFEEKEKTFAFTQQLLEKQYCKENYDLLENYCHREEYFEKAESKLKMIKFINRIRLVSDTNCIGQTEMPDFIEHNGAVPEITFDIEAKAEKFADQVILMMPDELWDQHKSLRQTKIEDIDRRKKAIANLPVFDIKQIPEAVIRKCVWAVLLDEEINEFMFDEDSFKKHIEPIVYLAWLLANDFLHNEGDGFWGTTEGIEFDMEHYELYDEGGLNGFMNYFSFDHVRNFLRVI